MHMRRAHEHMAKPSLAWAQTCLIRALEVSSIIKSAKQPAQTSARCP